jgi:pyruvate kinase
MLPAHRTKLVCTLGPASSSRDVVERMLRAGMNVARLNFSHGELPAHGRTIAMLREVAGACGHDLAILADLPGPKIRLGELARPLVVGLGETITLTTAPADGEGGRVPVEFAPLPHVVRPGHAIYVNDGFVRLEVEAIDGADVRCRVLAGGELSSRKGVNLPGAELRTPAFTARDRECLQFALEHGVDAISQSFVETRADVDAARAAAAELGHDDVFVIAKIERERALAHIDGILDAADGIMIARGDLGVEIPIERIAVVQKQLARLANLRGKPVITATQMLESMTHSARPTRAEATDVANAVLDGTDCVMLSGESAIGSYPVEAVAMLGKIAATTEPHRATAPARPALEEARTETTLVDLIAHAAANAVRRLAPPAVFVPTVSGASARSLSRLGIPAWIVAFTPRPATARRLLFSYGVVPAPVAELSGDWRERARAWLRAHRLPEGLVVLTGGPSPEHPGAAHTLALVDLSG